MASLHFRHMVEAAIEEAGAELGSLVLLYNDKKAILIERAELFETLLEEVATMYAEDKDAGVVDEIGMRCKSAVSDHYGALSEGDEEDVWGDDDKNFEQDMITAAVLDFLLYNKVITLPEHGESDDSENVGDDLSSSSDSE